MEGRNDGNVRQNRIAPTAIHGIAELNPEQEAKGTEAHAGSYRCCPCRIKMEAERGAGSRAGSGLECGHSKPGPTLTATRPPRR